MITSTMTFFNNHIHYTKVGNYTSQRQAFKAADDKTVRTCHALRP